MTADPLTTSSWPRDESVPLIDHTVGSLLAERARTHSDVVALAGSARRLTYRELYAEARQAAAGLLRLAHPGEHVALWAPNLVEWPIVQYGAALAGVVLVAVNPGPLPTFHTAGCVISTLGPLWLGGTMLLVEQFDPAAVLALIERERATLLFSVPTILVALLDAARKAEGPPPRLETVLVGAANVPGSVIEAMEKTFGAAVHNLFGQTELAPVLTLTRRSDTREDQVTSVGRPIPQVECKVVDPATGEVQPLGVPGEICARGYQQLIEYYNDPENTARTVDADGWVHTGDLGAMDARGMLTVTGRLKDLIIRGGENIAPAEIESCLSAHEAVLDAVVVGVPDARLGEKVAAVVRLRDPRLGAAEVREALVAHCEERLSRFKVPQFWFFVEEFPMTASGKVPKFMLRDAIATGELRPS